MEMISLLRAPAAIAITLILGYWMVKTIIWVQNQKDEEIARLNRERNVDTDY